MAQGFGSFFIYETDQQVTYRSEIEDCGLEIIRRNVQIVAFVGNCAVAPTGDRFQN